MKHGHEPQSLPKRARRTFDNWMSEGFEWSEKHQHIILKTDEPFPSQVSLQRQERTFIVLSGAKEAARKVVIIILIIIIILLLIIISIIIIVLIIIIIIIIIMLIIILATQIILKKTIRLRIRIIQ